MKPNSFAFYYFCWLGMLWFGLESNGPHSYTYTAVSAVGMIFCLWWYVYGCHIDTHFDSWRSHLQQFNDADDRARTLGERSAAECSYDLMVKSVFNPPRRNNR